MMYRVLAILLLFIGFAQSASQAQQILPASEYVKWQTTVSEATVAHGSEFTVHFKAEIATPWKLYAMDSPAPSWGAKLNFDPLPAGFAQVGDISQAKTKVAFDKNFKVDVSYFTGEAGMEARFKVDESAATGFQVLSGKIGYQICNDDIGICLPPTYEVFTAELDVVEPGSTPVYDTGNEQNREGLENSSLSSIDESSAPPSFIAESQPPLEVETEEAVVAAAPTNTTVTRSHRGLGGFILLAIGAGLGAFADALRVSYDSPHRVLFYQAFGEQRAGFPARRCIRIVYYCHLYRARRIGRTATRRFRCPIDCSKSLDQSIHWPYLYCFCTLVVGIV